MTPLLQEHSGISCADSAALKLPAAVAWPLHWKLHTVRCRQSKQAAWLTTWLLCWSKQQLLLCFLSLLLLLMLFLLPKY